MKIVNDREGRAVRTEYVYEPGGIHPDSNFTSEELPHEDTIIKAVKNTAENGATPEIRKEALKFLRILRGQRSH